MGNEDNPIENVQHKAASGEKKTWLFQMDPGAKGHYNSGLITRK